MQYFNAFHRSSVFLMTDIVSCQCGCSHTHFRNGERGRNISLGCDSGRASNKTVLLSPLFGSTKDCSKKFQIFFVFLRLVSQTAIKYENGHGHRYVKPLRLASWIVPARRWHAIHFKYRTWQSEALS